MSLIPVYDNDSMNDYNYVELQTEIRRLRTLDDNDILMGIRLNDKADKLRDALLEYWLAERESMGNNNIEMDEIPNNNITDNSDPIIIPPIPQIARKKEIGIEIYGDMPKSQLINIIKSMWYICVLH